MLEGYRFNAKEPDAFGHKPYERIREGLELQSVLNEMDGIWVQASSAKRCLDNEVTESRSLIGGWSRICSILGLRNLSYKQVG